jgi:hypothetical protein
MRLLTYCELSRYTKPQLRAALQDMLSVLPELPVRSLAYQNAAMNIRHIRMLLDRTEYRLKMRL